MTTNFARVERDALCDLFEEVGPDAPTLCEGWTTRDLAAHLVVRERRPDAAVGIVAPFAAGYGDQVRRRVARTDWADLVAMVRSGPPLLSPTRLDPVDRMVNTNEFFVHHEDVRRAIDGWEPRALDPAEENALWGSVARFAKLTLRRTGLGIVLDAGAGRRLRVIDREPTVEIAGAVGEIVLFSNGRQAHARVELRGPDDAVAKLRDADLGI